MMNDDADVTDAVMLMLPCCRRCNPAHNADKLPVVGTKSESCTVYDEWPIWVSSPLVCSESHLHL